MRFEAKLYLPLLIGGLFFGFQQNPKEHQNAIAEIQKLGGVVKVVQDKPGQPVTVALTGSQSSAKLMARLKSIINLHRVDL